MNTQLSKKRRIVITILFIILFAIIIFSFAFVIYRHTFSKSENISRLAKRDECIVKEVNEVNFNEYLHDKKNLVIFFSTTCSHCVSDAENITKFMNENKDIPIIMVSHDTDINNLNAYLEKFEYNWFVIRDPEKTIRASIDEGESGIPSFYLLDENANIINKHKGELTFDELVEFYNNKNLEE